MHVVADRPTIVSALPAPTSTCMRRKTHNACWRLSCNTEVRVLENQGPKPRPKTDGAPRAANHALARLGPASVRDRFEQELRSMVRARAVAVCEGSSAQHPAGNVMVF